MSAASPGKPLAEHGRLAASLALCALALLAPWMGWRYGGYYVGGWAPPALASAALLLVLAAAGALGRMRSPWSAAAAALLTGYAAWTFLSLLWSPDRGEAWQGAGLTLLYLLAFWAALSLLSSGASRRWALAACALGTGAVAALTLPRLAPEAEELFVNGRLLGTAGYSNAEAAFLLLPFWAALCLAGSPRVNPLLRCLALAAAALCSQLAVLTQSRGAAMALAASLPVFFLLSGRRMRGALALLPVAAALILNFPQLNGVYLAGEGAALEEALRRAVPQVWLAALACGLYGLGWALLDARWRPPARAARAAGAATLAALLLLAAAGGAAFYAREGSPVRWVQQKAEAFQNGDRSGQEQSRYLSASGSGRLVMWRVAWEDFARHPVLGVGTHNYEATYYRLREQTGGYVRQPHSLPLEVLAERGVVGGALLAGFLAVCVGAGLRERFGSLGGEGRAQVGALAAAVAYWFVHSSAEWFWQMPGVTLPAFLYLALLASPWRVARPSPLRWPLRAAAAAVALAAAAAVAPLYLADRAEAQSHGLRDPREALAAVERAQSLNPWDPRLREREAELAMQAGQWERAERAYRKAIELNPRHFAPYMRLATYYERRGRLEDALRSYREALRRNPLDEELQRKVGWLASSAGRERQE